jgi:hypothetical protein
MVLLARGPNTMRFVDLGNFAELIKFRVTNITHRTIAKCNAVIFMVSYL